MEELNLLTHFTWTLVALGALVLIFLILAYYWWRRVDAPLRLHRLAQNPILAPKAENGWEASAVFNPAAFVDGGKVHLLYRAMGYDGISRIGYAWSTDAVHFTRLPYPVYDEGAGFTPPELSKRKYRPLSYNTDDYASGGGWGGSEDPRAVKIDGRLYMNFVGFESWESIRIGLTSLAMDDFRKGSWNWVKPVFISPPRETNKNWLLFPERIHGKYAVLHSVTPKIRIAYVDSLEDFDGKTFVRGSSRGGGRPNHWDTAVRGAGAPPLKTPEGWLLFYHAMDRKEPHIGYKVGVMLLDLADPTKVLYRSCIPALEPTEWYENDWKPGVVYASGAVIFGDDLYIYYGGGDKFIAAARANLRDFLRRLTHQQNIVLESVKV